MAHSAGPAHTTRDAHAAGACRNHDSACNGCRTIIVERSVSRVIRATDIQLAAGNHLVSFGIQADIGFVLNRGGKAVSECIVTAVCLRIGCSLGKIQRCAS